MELMKLQTKEKLALLSTGGISAAENVEASASAIEKGNKEINAFISVDIDSASKRAKMLDSKKTKKGKLFGLTFGIKSNINVLGRKATCASKTLEDYVCPFSATVVERLLAEDAIIMGMTNMDEFALGSSGQSSFFGATKNPAAPDRIPGGSSSGSGAAVAAGMVDIALGSDTGGSIRMPASCCGVVGVKPSYGRVSRHGLIDMAMSLDQIGPFARDVYGAALALEVIAGCDDIDSTARDFPVDAYSETDAGVEGKRIGYSPDFEELIVDKRLNDVVDDAKRELERKGANLVELKLPHMDKALSAYYPIVFVEFFSATRRFDGRRYGLKIEDVCGPEVYRRIHLGSFISQKEVQGRYYKKALQLREFVKQTFLESFSKCDAIISPTVPKLPHKIDEELTPLEMYGYDYFTILANLSGHCAGVVPGRPVEGIPNGVQVHAAHFREKQMFGVMSALEGRR